MTICHVLKLTAASPPVNEHYLIPLMKYQLNCDSIDLSKCKYGEELESVGSHLNKIKF